MPNKATAKKAAAIAEAGITPLDFMLEVMRAPEPTREDGEDPALFVARYVGWRDRAFEAAKAAAPYVHPKLANVTSTVQGEVNYVARTPPVAGTTDDWKKQWAPPTLQ